MSKSIIFTTVQNKARDMYIARIDMALDYVAELNEDHARAINSSDHEKLSDVGPGCPELLCYSNIDHLCCNIKLSEFEFLEDCETMQVEIIRIFRKYEHEVNDHFMAVIQNQDTVTQITKYLTNQ